MKENDRNDYTIFPCKYLKMNNVNPKFISSKDNSSNYVSFSVNDGILSQNLSNKNSEARELFSKLELNVSALSKLDDDHLLLACESDKTELIVWNIVLQKIVKRVNIPYKFFELNETQHYNTFIGVCQSCSHENNDLNVNGLKTVVILKLEDHENFYQIEPIVDVKDISHNELSFCSYSGDLALKTKKNTIHIVNVYNYAVMNHCKRKLLLHSNSVVKCIEFSYDGVYLAVGTTDGMIYVYESDNLNLKNRFHWHCRDVEGLAFDMLSNNYLYSVGHEGVLVQWEITTKINRFLPRITSEPFKFIIGAYNKLVLVSRKDEIIHIDSHTFKISYRTNILKKNISTYMGLKYSPLNNCIVTNGNTGIIDFYSIITNNIVHSLSVVKKNIVTINKTIEIDVSDVVFLNNGHLLITVEQPTTFINRTVDPKSLINMSDLVKIKWWYYKPSKNKFKLFQTENRPHLSNITSIASNNDNIDLSSSIDDNKIPPMLITTGGDSYVKVWTLNTPSKHWKCITVLNYKNQIPIHCAFSSTLNIMAVSMEYCVVLWNIDPLMKFKINSIIPYESPMLTTFGGMYASNMLCILSLTKQQYALYNITTGNFTAIINKKNVYAAIADPDTSNMCLVTKSDDNGDNNYNLEIYDLSNESHLNNEEIDFHVTNFVPKNNSTATNRKSYLLQDVKLVSKPKLLYLFKNILIPSVNSINTCDTKLIFDPSKSICFVKKNLKFPLQIISFQFQPPKQIISYPMYILNSDHDIFCLSNKTYAEYITLSLNKCLNKKDTDTNNSNIKSLSSNLLLIDDRPYSNVNNQRGNHSIDYSSTKDHNTLLKNFDDDMSSLSSHTLANPIQLLKKYLNLSFTKNKLIPEEMSQPNHFENNFDCGFNIENWIKTELIAKNPSLDSISTIVNHKSALKQTITSKPTKRKSLDFISNI